jgi:hypothetical protein
MNQDLQTQMMQLMTGGVVAAAVSVAAELGIADLLHDRRQATRDLAATTGVDVEKVRLQPFLR